MLSLPDDWKYSVSGLVYSAKESKTSIQNALNELKRHGYLNVKKIYPNRTKSKQIEYIYDVYELLQIQKEDMENLDVDNVL